MPNKSLTEIIHEMVDDDRIDLPVYPSVIEETRKNLQQNNLDAGSLRRMTSRDPALVCNLFRAANSSLFKGLQKTITIEEAVTRLGEDKARQVLERSCHEGEGCPQGQLLPRYLKVLWEHALGCALGAQWLARRCGYQALADQAYLAGLLHDIGKLFLLATLEQISSCEDFGIEISTQLAEEVLDTMHVEQGVKLIHDWNLPETYITAIEEHHYEELQTDNIIVSLVKLANQGCQKIGLGLSHTPELILPTTAEAQFLGIDEITLAEYEIMLEDQFLTTAPPGGEASAPS